MSPPNYPYQWCQWLNIKNLGVTISYKLLFAVELGLEKEKDGITQGRHLVDRWDLVQGFLFRFVNILPFVRQGLTGLKWRLLLLPCLEPYRVYLVG